jgi:hypothetical protein
MLIVGFCLMFGGLFFFIVASGVSRQAGRRLVDYEFQNHHEQWIRDGRPVGGRITRTELSFWGSDFASILAWNRWALRRPEWLLAGSVGESFLVSARRWAWLSLLGLLLGVAGMVLFGRELVHAA